MYQVSRWSAISTQTVLVAWSVIVIFPMLWMVYSSFKTDQELFFSPWSPPAELQWDNFERAWNKAHVGEYLFNTLIVVIPALLLTLILSAMAAYVLARFRFVGNRFLFYLFLSGMLFPVFLALVPLFSLVNQLGMLNTFHGLILVYVAYSLPFTIFFLTGFFKTLPTELEESAIIDGANPFQVFFKVMLPMASPGLISMGIFNFLGMWNQYVLPLVLISDESKYMLSQGLAFMLFKQFYENDWSALFAALTIIMIPSLIVYITFQRQIQSGITTGALKG
ncbi:MAG: carbohydrate ABC transporter permease [Deltaproteobacteria bacterium]|jgi:N-acetylglucosamine transport system permease protein|nr:sugar ABC transporter permease [Paracoccaceae bacterium]NBR20387.1 carbohydrate ABC transporter permease [Pseudomonadota bacterium]|tara:strand:+ start:774 stop:1610 length:837 start_codon:yes stop_codon:yes gene_type:complete